MIFPLHNKSELSIVIFVYTIGDKKYIFKLNQKTNILKHIN